MDESTAVNSMWLLGSSLMVLVFVAGSLFFFMKAYRRVRPGQALIVSRMRDMQVFFTNAVVLPGLQSARLMDLSAKTLELSRRGDAAPTTKDDVRVDVDAAFLVGIKPTQTAVLRVAQALGPDRSYDAAAVEEFVAPKLSEALEAAVRERDFQTIDEGRIELSDALKARAQVAFEAIDIQGVAITQLKRSDAGAMESSP